VISITLFLAALTGGLLAYSSYAADSAVRAHPPMGSFIEIEGLRLHYLDSAPAEAGQTARPTILLLHGASSNLRDFAISLFPALATRYRVIAVDRPGYGYSERPPSKNADWVNPAVQARLLHGLSQKIGVHRPIVVGHSWAGSVALAYALEYPEDTGGVVSLAGASHPWRSDPAFHNRWPAIPVLGDVFLHTLAAPGFALASGGAVERNFAPNSPPLDYANRAGLTLLVRPGNWRANAEDMRNLAAFLAVQKNRYETIRLPLTIIFGEDDKSVNPENHARRLHHQVAGSKLILLPHTGHSPHHAHPDIVIDAIHDIARQMQSDAGANNASAITP
jgi:pimeloyl-ACP methyl ester carboxylesterase